MTSPFSGSSGDGFPDLPPTAGDGGGGEARVAVAVVDDDQATRSRMAMQLGNGTAAFASIGELAASLTGAPVVVVLGPSLATSSDLSTTEQLLAARREVGAIMVTDELSTDTLQRALRAGVKDVLQAPVDSNQFDEAIGRVAATLRPAPATAPPMVVEGEAPGELGRVIMVFSTKGGSGKSVIASNLAVLLAERSEKPVVLVDADLQFGDVAVMLKLTPQHTIVDAVGSLDRLDDTLLKELLATHEPEGLWVLPAPLEPAFADQIGAAEMVRIVEQLRSFAGHVVIDTPAYFNDVVLGLIEISDDVLLVAGMDIPNIKNVKIGLQTLRLLNTPMEKLRLILNRANSKVRLDASEVERTLGVQADALIPSDIVVPQSVNRGEPVVHVAPKSSVAKSFNELADLFLPAPAKKRRR
ncbi:AAA family ATPase [Rhabdothermincola salaria]|uniref:AAA family ATPase n=1 Tax=Rhabdothermincola salaria TaxID=2903142 RepID=UPI001E5339C8|nr:P-loop NTPase [Rhabdothermincola salaria]